MSHWYFNHLILRGLNAPQQEVVTTTEGALLVRGGPGTGKTKSLTHRIAWLLEMGNRPSQILALTFSHNAACDMRKRVQALTNVPMEQLWVSTFHSFCTRILRREGDRTSVGRDFTIFDPSDQEALVRQVLAELKLPEKQFHPKKILEVISDWKNRCLLPAEAREEALDAWTRKALDAYELYQTGLKNHRACDFDDLLLHTERLFREPGLQAVYAERFNYLLVDEYQDTNWAQYLIVQHLAKQPHNLCVAGDEDLSIYGWCGADIKNILDFQRDFPKAVQIEFVQNYRSTEMILGAASHVIENNTQRLAYKGRLTTQLGEGERLTFKLLDDGHLEAEWVVNRIREERALFPDAKIAILYRANWQSIQLVEALRSVNMPYTLVDEVRAESLGLPEFLDRVSLASDSDNLEEEALLSLMTIHCAKGLEFPVVFLVGMEEEVFPNRNARETDEGLEEERRLFYVAITRAQRRLFLTAARRRRVMGSEMLGMPSRFLRELPAEALETPIRWGTELYQSGQGVFSGPRAPQGGGGSSVASELQRIRGMFERTRMEGERAAAEGGDEAQASQAQLPPLPAVAGDAWPKGARVRSPRFGRGVILGATGAGDSLTYTVRFEGGEKRILVRFGMLEREGE